MSVRAVVCSIVAVAAIVLGEVSPAAADCARGTLTGAAALASDWSKDGPGLCRTILPADLPQPSASNTSFARVVQRPAGAWPRLPPGFHARPFYQNDTQTRLIRTAPNGDIFVAESQAGRIRVLRPTSNGHVATTAIFTSGLYLPFGIAFYPPGPSPHYVYVAQNDKVVRFPYTNGDLAAAGAPQTIVPSLPQGAGQLPGRGHWTRDVVFSGDGQTMFVSVGSYSNDQNDGEDETGRAQVLSFKPDGSGRTTFASGIRNPVALAVSPVDGALWASTNERDALGDNLVPDYITRVGRGQFYGWPWFYIGNHLDPRHKGDYPRNHPPIAVPSLLLQAHSASLGMAFYTGTQFPQAYRGNLFIAEHGSWNRKSPTGSKVIRVVFDQAGRPTTHYEDFVTGFVVSNHNVWGRPVGIAVGKDGSLFISEDANNTIWRIYYTG